MPQGLKFPVGSVEASFELRHAAVGTNHPVCGMGEIVKIGWDLSGEP
jgi:hypothetical protein